MGFVKTLQGVRYYYEKISLKIIISFRVLKDDFIYSLITPLLKNFKLRISVFKNRFNKEREKS